jgi:hypothetical protein
MLRLIFNGSQIVSAAPRNGKRNMTEYYWDPATPLVLTDRQAGRTDAYLTNVPGLVVEFISCLAGLFEHEPPSPLAPVAQPEIVDAAKALIDKAIAMVGFEEVERLIKPHKPKGKRGRPNYEAMDFVLITLGGAFQIARKRNGKRLLTPHAITKKIVDLCWDDYDVMKRLGFRKCLRDFRSNKETVVKRLLSRNASYSDPAFDLEFLEELKRDCPEFYATQVSEAMEQLVSGAVSRAAEQRAGLLDALHRQRPDLHLLPGKSFR